MTDAPELLLERIACVRLHPLQHQIRRKQEWEKEQVLYEEVNHAGAIASFGHWAAHAPQSTHLSASIT